MFKKPTLTNLIIIILFISVFSSCKKDENVLDKMITYDTSHTQNWMQDLLETYPNATLKDICIPRAHDAGIYEVNNCLAGNKCNSQTQYLDMKTMLESGIRVFDVRPVLKNGVFWTYHATACNGFGCEGDNLENFLQQTKDYLDNHNELVIFEVSNFCNTDAQDGPFLNILNTVLGESIFKDDGSNTTDFIDRPLNSILEENGTSGKVLLLMDALNSATESRSGGFFAHSYLKRSGTYANKFIFEDMITDQLIKFNNYNQNSNSIFKFAYTLTLNDSLAVACATSENPETSIESLSLNARAKLTTTFDNWISDGTIAKGKIPNIISVDYANTTVTETCIKISELNLE